MAAAQTAVTAMEATCKVDDSHRRSYVLHADDSLAVTADFVLNILSASGCLTKLLGLSKLLDSEGGALAAAGTRFLYWLTSWRPPQNTLSLVLATPPFSGLFSP